MNSKQDIKQEVLMKARDLNIHSIMFRNAIRAKLGLNITESECLSFLSINGVSTPTQLAHFTGLTTGSITILLDRLEKSGFIKRTPNPKDRRGVLIEIEKGWFNLTKPLVSALQEDHQKLLADYQEKDLKIIANFLSKFTVNITKNTKIINKI